MTCRSRKSCSPKVILETVAGGGSGKRERGNSIDIPNSLSTLYTISKRIRWRNFNSDVNYNGRDETRRWADVQKDDDRLVFASSY